MILAAQIRRLLPADATALWQLRLEALERDPEAFGPTPEEHCHTAPDPSDPRLLEYTELHPEARTFVLGAFAPGSLAGPDHLVAIATFARESSRKEAHKGHIRGVYVTPAHRGHGLARLLLANLIESVRLDQTLEQLHLAVGVHREAPLRLYRSLGFTVYGTEPHALKVNGVNIDEHLMILPLRTR